MQRNHPEIPVWYSDRKFEGNYSLDVQELIRASYGAVLFLHKGFTNGFLVDGRINMNSGRDRWSEECVTVHEIIEIEKAIQTRSGFELHTVNLDGEALSAADQKKLEAVFAQAGILTPESVARYAQRNINPFFTARDHEDAFFDRMVCDWMPLSALREVQGNFRFGSSATTVDVLCWDCRQFIAPENIRFALYSGALSLYRRIEAARLQGAPPKQDDDVLSVVQFSQGLTSVEERKTLRFSFIKGKYHLFKKALDLWDRNGFEMSREIMRCLNDEEGSRMYPIPNAMGLALMVVTADRKPVFSRRSRQRGVRSGEFDCSIVEGLIPEVNPRTDGAARYDYTAPDYIRRECARAFCEEICVEDSPETSLFGLVLDKKYGQWSLTGLVRSRLTAQEIQALHPTRRDTTETNTLYFVDLFDAAGRGDLSAVGNALRLYKRDGMWDTALAALFGSLLLLGFGQDEINRII